ncbi:WD-repeat protein, putative [Perkinsus marinus ATCC 50983]|uniref:Cilia- and flagella-associated protein 52 n=1 Tax=Perkinsus marinus (strain ATCC 50983 / TXsc) TaxID=423536 RepID=C5KBT5_PERM5|nr:WD-repeat protein, putative [Perkinsus marinus ATCC 50983]EER17966.1 WD-repeat protein, putative [Perkinsus marinus ATCC 50983]|eukprot:XP_002786170.1 WD-repeat protein, putative [Perkinsus marinus ATCC 50983]
MTVEASATNDAPPAEVAEEKAKIVEQVVDARELELQAVIGFKGAVIDGMQLHPDNKHLLYPLGCTVVVRNLIERTQDFMVGHDNQVNCITISDDGAFVASGQKTFMGFPADAIIWDFATRKPLHKLSLHKVAVSSLSFSYNNKYLATLGGRDDNALVVWDVKSGQPICGTPAAADTAHTVKFFHNSDVHLISGGNYHIRLWHLDLKNKKIHPAEVSTGNLKRVITNICISKDDKLAYCGTQSGDILEVNLDRGIYKRLGPHKQCLRQGISCIRILDDGDLIAGSGDGTIVKIEARTFRVATSCKVLGCVTSIALTEDATHFFASTSYSNVYWVDASPQDAMTPELRNTCHHEPINQVVFPHDFSEVFATCSKEEVRVWNSRTRQELLRIQVPNVECYCVDFAHDGRSIATGWHDGKIRAFLPQSGKLLYVINDAHKNGVTAITCSSDTGRLVSGGMEGEVRCWRLGKNGQSQVMESSLKEHRGRVWCIRLTSDNTKAVSASSDGSCIVWDLVSRTRSLCLFDSTMFKSLVYHPDETQLVTTGTDRKITYWDTFDGQSIRILEGSETAELCTLSMSKSGSHFVSGGADRIVKVWDYDEGVCNLSGAGHSGTISSVAISPDQTMIVSVGHDGGIFIWKIPEGISEKCCDTSNL